MSADQTLTPSRAIAAARPAPMEMGLVARLADDVRRERRIRRRSRLPPGSTAASWMHTRRIITDPLGLLLEHEQRFGPVFTVRLLHEPIVWAIGPRSTIRYWSATLMRSSGGRGGSRTSGRSW